MRSHLYASAALSTLLLQLSPHAAAQTSRQIPDNTISCADFKKNTDGTWTTVADTTFRFAGSRVTLKAAAHVTNSSYFYDNNRLIDTLNAQCSSR